MTSDMLAAGCKLREVLAGEDRLALEQAFIASDDEAP